MASGAVLPSEVEGGAVSVPGPGAEWDVRSLEPAHPEPWVHCVDRVAFREGVL